MTEADRRGKHVHSLSCIISMRKGQEAKSEAEVVGAPAILKTLGGRRERCAQDGKACQRGRGPGVLTDLEFSIAFPHM